MFRKMYYYSECFKRGMENYDITIEQMKKMQMQGGLVCDVRSPQEYKEGHINGALLIPEYDINKKAEKIFPNKNQVIILYCDTGIRSYTALKKLKRIGYKNVYNLYKGTEHYIW